MPCDDCKRHKIAENVDGLQYDVDELKRTWRNQGIVLAILIVAGVWVLARLNAKGILTYAELIEGPAGG